MKKLLLLLIIPFLSFGQIIPTLDCNSIPNPGICDGYFPTFYFNQTTSQCEESYWGGCEGVVPFWTLEDCQNSCHNSLINVFTITKLLLKKMDVLGREANNKGLQLHIYDDGSVEKKYLIK